MSMLALFYTLPADHLEALIESSKPATHKVEKGFLFFKRIEEETKWDAFWDFLDEKATEQDTYNYSGRGFLDFDLILMDKKQMIWSFSNEDVSNKIYEHLGLSIAIFDKSSADNVINMLSQVDLDETDINKYYLENNISAEERGEWADKAIFAAYDQAQKWFSSIREGEIGILLIT